MPRFARFLGVFAALLLFGVLSLPPTASALSKEDAAAAEAKALDAKFKFKAGKFEAAAPLFLQAFAISRKPALLYNAARAYEEAGKPAEAKVAFEQYLGLPGLSASGKADAKRHIETLKTKIAARDKAAQEKAKADAAAKEQAARQQAEQQKAQQLQAAKDAAAAKKAAENNGGQAGGIGVTKPAKPPEPSRNKWVTWGLVGGASIFVLSAIASQLAASQAMDDANAMDFSVDNQFDEAQVEAKRKQYNSKVQLAQQQQGSALFGAVVGLGLGGWAAYRLLTPDPGLTATHAHVDGPLQWNVRPNVGTTELGWTTGLTLGGRF